MAVPSDERCRVLDVLIALAGACTRAQLPLVLLLDIGPGVVRKGVSLAPLLLASKGLIWG